MGTHLQLLPFAASVAFVLFYYFLAENILYTVFVLPTAQLFAAGKRTSCGGCVANRLHLSPSLANICEPPSEPV